MDTAQLALIISIISAAIAGTSLGWNIYRDIVLKAKVVVTAAIKNLYIEGQPRSPDFIGVTATNHGPGNIILQSIILKDTSLLKRITKKERHAIVLHDYTNPHSGNLPVTLEVGQSVDLFLSFNDNCFLKEDMTLVGVSDSFGRTNWAHKKSMKVLREKWLSSFSSST